jgi:hypothetical protein
MNTNLYRLINSLPFQRIQETYKTIDNDALNLKVFRINLNNFKLTNSLTFNNPPLINDGVGTVPKSFYVVYQDYETVTSWTDVESIVITSTSIPVKQSARSAAMQFIDGISSSKNSSNIFELEINDIKAGNYVPGIIYVPNEKRWMNLLNQRELSKINISLYYRSKKTGDLIPIFMHSDANFSMKLVFRKPIKRLN